MIVLPLLALVLLIGLCFVVWRLAVYALPFMLGLQVAQSAYASSSSFVGSCTVGFAAGIATYGLLVTLILVLRPTIVRIGLALVFALPAGAAGFALVHGMTTEAVSSDAWRIGFCLLGGGLTGMSALMRLASDICGDRGACRMFRPRFRA
ncbi:hypothetical protein ACQZ5D_25060 [Agrobacterium sp. 22-211-1]